MTYWMWIVMLTESLSLAGGNNLAHSIRSVSTERRQLPSRRLLAVTTGTVAVTTASPSYPTLDRSFKTNPYWVKLDLTIPADTDIKRTEFIVTMETNLAKAYSAGKMRRDERAASMQTLLARLNPDNDPLLNWRQKRAATFNGITAQVIDLSRDLTYPINVALVFYMAEGDTNTPAGECRAIFSELTPQEMTMYLQTVVKSAPVEFVQPAIPTPTSASSSSLLALWIVLGILGGFMLVFLCCCCTFCICCRRPMRPSPDGPMDADTYKMLQHQQKYPYRPYKTPNQTSNGIHVTEEASLGLAKEPGSEVRLQNSGTGSALRSKLDVLSAARLSNNSYTDLSESGSSMDSPPPGFKKLAGDKDTVASSGDLNNSGRSHQSGRTHQLRLLPRGQRDQLRNENTQTTGKLSSRSTSGNSSEAFSTREADELRRIYLEAQREISRVLEPDIIPDQSNQTYTVSDRRLGSRGKSKKGRREVEERDTEFQENLSDHSVSEEHCARRTSRNQGIINRRPETLQEAKRKVHSLIDEAFSLVGLSKNVVCPAPSIAGDNTPRITDEDRKRFQRNISGSAPNLTTEVGDREASFTAAEDENVGSKKHLKEQGTRVVVVPVTHRPDRIGNDIIWNPYNAEDQLAELQKSQELSLAADTSLGHKPHQPAKHLTLPHPASFGETKRELTSKQTQRGKNRRLSADDTLMESERRVSTGLGRQSTGLARRLSTDSDLSRPHNTTADDPYLDPYLKKTVNDELDASYMSPLSDSLSSTEDNPYAIALSRSKKDSHSKKLVPASKKAAANMSTLPREHQVGRAVEDGYDELDVTRNISQRDKPGEVVAAIREELIRLAKRSGQQGSSS